MIKQLLLATHNHKKVSELKKLLSSTKIEVFGVDDLSEKLKKNIVEPDEPYSTYHENASHKARVLMAVTQMPVLADDSGLEVTMLPGELGVKSKRFVEGTDEDRITELLKRLEGVENRSAKFVTVLSYLEPNHPEPIYFIGEVQGRILTQSKGKHGFGYDPVFLPDGYMQSFAEMEPEKKNAISHRGRALAHFAEWLRSM